MSDDPRQGGAPRDVLLVLRLVHGAILISILVYGGIMAAVTRPPPGDAVLGAVPVGRAEPPGWLSPLMAALAAVGVVAVLAVRARMARQREAAASAGDEEARRLALARYYSGSIISWALADSVAIAGLVLGIAHRSTDHFLPFAGASLVVMLLSAPRQRHMDALAGRGPS